MGLILVLDPAVSLVIWMAKARFLAKRPLQTLKVPGYTLKIMFQKYMKPRENETQQGKRTRKNSRNKTKHSGPILTNESIFYVFTKIRIDGKKILATQLATQVNYWRRLVTYSSNNEIFWQNDFFLNVHFVYQRKQIFAAELHNIVLTIYGNFSMTLAYL